MDSRITRSLDTGKSYLHAWIDDTTQEQDAELVKAHVHDFEADECLTIRFHACCVRVLQKICRQLSKIGSSELEQCALDIELRVLQEELARLYLCGDGFTDEEMVKILDYNKELRDNLLEILCEIGVLLIRGRYRCKSRSMIFYLSDIYRRPKSDIGKLCSQRFRLQQVWRTARLCLRF